VHADNGGGSSGRGSQMTVGLSKKHFLRLYAATSSETLEIRPAIL